MELFKRDLSCGGGDNEGGDFENGGGEDDHGVVGLTNSGGGDGFQEKIIIIIWLVIMLFLLQKHKEYGRQALVILVWLLKTLAFEVFSNEIFFKTLPKTIRTSWLG